MTYPREREHDADIITALQLCLAAAAALNRAGYTIEAGIADAVHDIVRDRTGVTL
jgi:hypothetical protein